MEGFGVKLGKTCMVKMHVMGGSGGGGAMAAVRHLRLVQSSTEQDLQPDAGHLMAA